jgi:hypothetical protein
LNCAQKFLNLKKCAKIGTIEFKNLKNWAHTYSQKTSQKTILCQNRDLRFTSKGRTGHLGFDPFLKSRNLKRRAEGQVLKS